VATADSVALLPAELGAPLWTAAVDGASRVSVGSDGTVAALHGKQIAVFDAQGAALGDFSVSGTQDRRPRGARGEPVGAGDRLPPERRGRVPAVQEHLHPQLRVRRDAEVDQLRLGRDGGRRHRGLRRLGGQGAGDRARRQAVLRGQERRRQHGAPQAAADLQSRSTTSPSTPTTPATGSRGPTRSGTTRASIRPPASTWAGSSCWRARPPATRTRRRRRPTRRCRSRRRRWPTGRW
jgi:hypothetical protein